MCGNVGNEIPSSQVWWPENTDRLPGFIHVVSTDWRGQQPLYSFTRSKDYVCSFPGGPVVKNPLCSAGDASSNLVREDPTCLGATKPMSRNYWSPCALEPALHKRSHCNEKSEDHNSRAVPTLQPDKAHVQQRRPSAVKNKYMNIKKNFFLKTDSEECFQLKRKIRKINQPRTTYTRPWAGSGVGKTGDQGPAPDLFAATWHVQGPALPLSVITFENKMKSS